MKLKFDAIRNLLNLLDPTKRLGDTTVDVALPSLEREHSPSRAATDRGEIPSQALGRAYLVLLEHRDELLQLLEEKRAEFLVPRATPVGDQAINSGLRFIGANPEAAVSPVPAPPSGKTE